MTTPTWNLGSLPVGVLSIANIIHTETDSGFTTSLLASGSSYLCGCNAERAAKHARGVSERPLRHHRRRRPVCLRLHQPGEALRRPDRQPDADWVCWLQRRSLGFLKRGTFRHARYQAASGTNARSAAQAVAWMDDHTGIPNRSRSSGTTCSVGSWEHAMNSARLPCVTVASAFSRT